MKRHGYWLWELLHGYIREPSFLNCNHHIFYSLFNTYIYFNYVAPGFCNIGIRARFHT
jgi:hypothetical protein